MPSTVLVGAQWGDEGKGLSLIHICVVEAAVSRNVDFVVVSGDIFDSVRASYRDYLRFFDGLNRLDAEGIPSYLCTGNHDPLSLWQQDFFALPQSATMLAADRPDFALYERDGRCLLYTSSA